MGSVISDDFTPKQSRQTVRISKSLGTTANKRNTTLKAKSIHKVPISANSTIHSTNDYQTKEKEWHSNRESKKSANSSSGLMSNEAEYRKPEYRSNDKPMTQGDDVKNFLDNESASDNKTLTHYHRCLFRGSSRVRWLRHLSASKLEHETRI